MGSNTEASGRASCRTWLLGVMLGMAGCLAPAVGHATLITFLWAERSLKIEQADGVTVQEAVAPLGAPWHHELSFFEIGVKGAGQVEQTSEFRAPGLWDVDHYSMIDGPDGWVYSSSFLVVFQVAAPTDYLLTGSQGFDFPPFVRLSDDAGADVFFERGQIGDWVDITLSGRLAPGTYTFESMCRHRTFGEYVVLCAGDFSISFAAPEPPPAALLPVFFLGMRVRPRRSSRKAP